MQAESKYLEQVESSIMAGYAASTDDRNYVILAESLSKWDEETYPDKLQDEARIAEELYKLMTFLEGKGLKRQSDEVFRAMLLTFPERHFAQSPVQNRAAEIDLSLFKKINSDNMLRFEDRYRMALADTTRLIHDIELRQFREGCTGLAGELFSTFVAAAHDATVREYPDTPWELMHQLSWHLNNSVKAYNQAYGILRSLLSLKDPTPGDRLAEELDNSMMFFKRNHYWSLIDKASMRGDTTTMVMYIDRLMPMVTAGDEKSNLVMLRAKAVKKAKNLPWGCILIALIIGTALFFINYFFEKYQTGQPDIDSQTPTTLPTTNRPDPGSNKKNISNIQEPASMSLKVFNRAGLDESKPPQPLGRKLTLSEIRYVVFQKHRLEHLEGIDLTEKEEEALRQLWHEWRIRGETAEYDNKDRYQAEAEAKIYSQLLKGDAEDQLKLAIKELQPDDWKTEDDEEEKVQNKPPAEISDSSQRNPELLNLHDPADIAKILTMLEKTGFYHGPTDLLKWNSVAGKALARFKAAKMLRTDQIWDIETQQALISTAQNGE